MRSVPYLSLLLTPVLALTAFAAPATHKATTATMGSTMTSLGATPSTISQGESVALTAFVQPVAGGTTPTGTVQFKYGSQVLGSQPLSNGIANLEAPSTNLLPGSYNLTAVYSGDTNYQGSTSNVETVTISLFPTTTSLVLPNSVNEGATISFSAQVQHAEGTRTPTGSVNLVLGSTVLETAPLLNGTATFTANSSGYASGTYALTAVYSGDAYYASSTAASQNITVVGTTSTTVAFGAHAYAMGQSATATATVTAQSGGSPTGTVTFAVGPNVLGSAPLVAGVATLTESTAGVPISTYPVTATYSGSKFFQPSSGTADVNIDPAYTLSPLSVGLAPGGTDQFSLSPTVTGSVTWYVNGIAGGNSTVGTISSTGLYTAPATATTAVTASIQAGISTEPTYLTPAASAYVIPAAVITTTANPQVASYTVNLPVGASLAVNFGQTTSYGLNTWQQPAPDAGGNLTILVAGMIANIPYHLQGVVNLPGSATFDIGDQTFTPGGYNGSAFPTMVISHNTAPNPGIELIDEITSPNVPIFATDLDANVIWGYAPTDSTPGDIVQGVKTLPNGHVLLVLSQNSDVAMSPSGVPAGSLQVAREVDLAGNTIQQMTIATLNANLVTAGYKSLNILTIHHEITVTPNGHWLILGNIIVVESNLTGSVGTPVNVLGDVIVDVDPANNFAVGWVWNEFDHLDVNRHPYQFPDWTHTNAIVYSTDDGNILVSIRHQNWVIKVKYTDGTGDGSIIWKLGAQGDFTLENSTTLDDWFYAQHKPSFTTANSTGTFGLTLMDNGDDRGVYTNTQCGTGSNPACYSTVPNLTIDETNMTVTKTFPDVLPTTDYSFFGGNAEGLGNGNIEYDLCSHTANGSSANSDIRETTTGSSPEVVWEMDEASENFYRAFRIGSLYPGVTWTPGAGILDASREAHKLKPGEEMPAVKYPAVPTPPM